eukprot:14800701-Alexandrium_andersonii.AAC.1
MGQRRRTASAIGGAGGGSRGPGSAQGPPQPAAQLAGGAARLGRRMVPDLRPAPGSAMTSGSRLRPAGSCSGPRSR